MTFITLLYALAILPSLYAAPTLLRRADNPILPEQTLTLLDNVASTTDNTSWTVNVYGYLTTSLANSPIKDIISLFSLNPNAEDLTRLEERIKLFSVIGVQKQPITVQLPAFAKAAGQQTVTLEPTSVAGEINTTFTITADVAGKPDATLDYKAVLDPSDKRDVGGRAFLVPSEGYSIISDIDDTIKISEVNDKKKLLDNTFLKPFTPVPQMSDLYNKLASGLRETNQNPAFHYLSGSPWNLFRPLLNFTQEFKFPPGQFILRDLAVLDGSFIDFLTQSKTYKLERIELLLRSFPNRKLIMFGDSTEADPEIYGEVARRFPNNVSCISIRRVTGVNAGKEKTQLADDRFEKAFANVDKSKWRTFADATEISADSLAKGLCQNA
ncbi:uncharacterized protein SPPG_06672 [Spizellomyces punctatus DAOM BR117]|uniref:Phosphatidate phosphatase APP1 catalytic domain-containing protein n=2 Tax=Spizellomyces punctatus (strain DAOM BR117) TaxID=645134 RepID=A0A0L0H9P2_SPIPD|nr:uncharacterized protein SPPG_06672 [Spizellomyces punctatus DAOM BR117]KNC98275.1 hypothetical protein SPPG_06672 [Spizellomyces punctatus DAOM BR117]|eukprot:XP_016606315.1 hypothetical protein SPPG_06672 [Spizellomyces punctatus DAOM BR117]